MFANVGKKIKIEKKNQKKIPKRKTKKLSLLFDGGGKDFLGQVEIWYEGASVVLTQEIPVGY